MKGDLKETNDKHILRRSGFDEDAPHTYRSRDYLNPKIKTEVLETLHNMINFVNTLSPDDYTVYQIQTYLTTAVEFVKDLE